MLMGKKSLSDVLKPLQGMKDGLADLQRRNVDENVKKSAQVDTLRAEIQANDDENSKAAIAAKNLETLATIDLAPDTEE